MQWTNGPFDPLTPEGGIEDRGKDYKPELS
jgi:hypothetical protein